MTDNNSATLADAIGRFLDTHEPQIIAYCTCGWESPVFEAGASAQDAYAVHRQEADHA